MHDVMLSQGATSQPYSTQCCDNMPYKCYGIHSNGILNRYFYYNPIEFIWMCRLMDTPACELAVAEIEQQLEDEHDLDFRGLLRDKVIYRDGHWRPLEATNGLDDIERVQVQEEEAAMPIHSEKGREWLSSTAVIDENTKGYRHSLVVDNSAHPNPSFTPNPPRPVKNQGERMIVPKIVMEFIEERTDSKNESDIDANASVEPPDNETNHQVVVQDDEGGIPLRPYEWELFVESLTVILKIVYQSPSMAIASLSWDRLVQHVLSNPRRSRAEIA